MLIIENNSSSNEKEIPAIIKEPRLRIHLSKFCPPVFFKWQETCSLQVVVNKRVQDPDFSLSISSLVNRCEHVGYKSMD